MLSLGCSDYNIFKIHETPEPDIEVTPVEYHFGQLNVSESLSSDFLIRNLGTDNLG